MKLNLLTDFLQNNNYMFCLLSSLQAALKQLARNKVPNMAVLLKSIIHTHTDAKAVFKDPTGSNCTLYSLFCL